MPITLNVYVIFDEGERRKVKPGDELDECGSDGRISNDIKKLSIDSSTNIWCSVTNYSQGITTTCNHYIYTNNCQNTGTLS